MPTTLEIVQGLSDSEVAEVSKELFKAVYAKVPYKDVRNNAEAAAELAPLLSLDDDALKRDLSSEASARFGRLILEQYALDSELAPFVQEAWEKVQKSDNLVVGVVLAVGLVVNLTLLVATTELKVEKGADGKTTWKLVKKKVKPELMKVVLEPVVEAVKPLLREPA